MSGKILLLGGPDLPVQLPPGAELIAATSVSEALAALSSDDLQAIVLTGCDLRDRAASALLLPAGGILSRIPEGLAVLDAELNIVWSNARFQELTGSSKSLAGQSFYDAFGTPEILGPDFCPFHNALGSQCSTASLLRIGDKSYFQIQVTPVVPSAGVESAALVVIVRDTSTEVLQQQKLNAIYQAGLELGDLSPQELARMTVQDRIDLLKSKIIHYTKDLLEFETVEIRLLDRQTKRLDSLLVVGMQPEAVTRELYARPKDNGVTGFVAASGKSYLCEDTATDPLYLPGAAGARSSLTVPLILHEEILGTFNVESTRPGAFSENDLQFLELFSREVAVALNTLELLVAEKLSATTQSIDLILREVAGPVDEVLNEATWILERYIGHDPNVAERLQKILKHTRDIKQLIHKVGESITPQVANAPLPQRLQRPKLRHKRVLVADDDDSVRQAAHELLGRFACTVETAHNGEEAVLMARRFEYDVVLVDIRLPDMSGYDCFRQIKEIHPDRPVIFMTGYGYDAAHSIVKARQQGGLAAVLYKPFRVDQLLNEVEKAAAQSDCAVAGA